MSIRSVFYFCALLYIIFLSYQLHKVSPVSKLSKSDEIKKAPVHILIVSSWRSGSSFIGQIFNHHPDVFYLFEPGHSVWMRFRKEGAKLLHYAVRDLIHSLFTCDVTSLQHYVSGDRQHISSISFFAESRALCSLPSCSLPLPPEGYNRSKCFQRCKKSTFDEMEKACDTYSHRVMKTVRILDYSVLLPLFRDPVLDLRIIHLVRDPRAIASSRKYFDLSVDDPIVLKEHDKATKGPVMATICKAQANINKMVNTAGDYLKRRYLLIRHEDLSREPIANTKKIYEFSGLKMTPDLEQWVYNITHFNVREKNAFMTFSRKSSNVVQQWRKTMDFNNVKEIEEYCKEAMDLFGYLPVGSRSDQQNMSLDFVL
ncbi:carbohydrate sulfotransferase 4-like [Dendrobates tinctorius]|uniref:carbohydrate sulfotransferase 4-like n=1 Tax=Dendrobates tinctorius TaxID=92724 RepID=UPI003CC9838B